MHGHILAATGVSKLIIIVMPIYTWAQYLTCTYGTYLG